MSRQKPTSSPDGAYIPKAHAFLARVAMSSRVAPAHQNSRDSSAWSPAGSGRGAAARRAQKAVVLAQAIVTYIICLVRRESPCSCSRSSLRTCCAGGRAAARAPPSRPRAPTSRRSRRLSAATRRNGLRAAHRGPRPASAMRTPRSCYSSAGCPAAASPRRRHRQALRAWTKTPLVPVPPGRRLASAKRTRRS